MLDVRSDIILATTEAKLALLTRDHQAVLTCFQAIKDGCLAVDSGADAFPDTRADSATSTFLKLKLKVVELSKLHLSNTTAASQIIANAALFIAYASGESRLASDDVYLWNRQLDDVTVYLEQRVLHAAVYGDVAKEWLDEQRRLSTSQGESSRQSGLEEPMVQGGEDTDGKTAFGHFSPMEFLHGQGVEEPLMTKLAQLASDTKRYGLELLRVDHTIAAADVIEAITVIESDLRSYSPDARAQLKGLIAQPLLIDEMASAYTISWHDLSAWRWPKRGISSSQQRHLSGKERNFLNVAMSDLVFLQIVGQKWTSHFLDHLRAIRSSSAWPDAHILQGLATGKEKQLESMLAMLEEAREEEPDLEIVKSEGTLHAGLSWLSGRFASTLRAGYAERDIEHTEDARSSGWTAVVDASRTTQAHGHIFRNMCADISMVKSIASDVDIVLLHSDLEDFGPSVPHDVAVEVLRFFGMPPVWLDWFKTYLAIPLRDSTGHVRIARKGTPFGLAVSTLVNELLLILLDITLAKQDGVTWYRQHDDIWFWCTSSMKAATVWATMNDFTSRTGLVWSKDKTGCTVIGSAGGPLPAASLPNQPLKWGILELSRNGEWQIDAVKMKELGNMMKAEILANTPQSFLSRINLWNRFNGYIARNVGPVTLINGAPHVQLLRFALHWFQSSEQIIEKGSLYDDLVDLFRRTFPQHSTYTLDKLRLSWPFSLGGLQLHPHIIQTHVMDSILRQEHESDWHDFDSNVSVSKLAYSRYCHAWDSDWGQRGWSAQIGNANHPLWGTTQRQPPPVDERTFLRWHALHTDRWRKSYEAGCKSITLLPADIAKSVDRIHGTCPRLALETEYDRLLSHNLVPMHVAVGVEAAARQMFSVLPCP